MGAHRERDPYVQEGTQGEGPVPPNTWKNGGRGAHLETSLRRRLTWAKTIGWISLDRKWSYCHSKQRGKQGERLRRAGHGMFTRRLSLLKAGGRSESRNTCRQHEKPAQGGGRLPSPSGAVLGTVTTAGAQPAERHPRSTRPHCGSRRAGTSWPREAREGPGLVCVADCDGTRYRD